MIDKSAGVTTESTQTGRRAFLRKSALTALLAPVAVGALAACEARKEPGAAAPSAPPPKSEREMADEMDRMHEAGVKAFPAKTVGKGNQPMEPRLDNGVKVYELNATKTRWE
ncbi:MAG: hypothetical protein ABIV11_07435, partial [Gemmatimonadaceae bacterium]